MKKRPSPRKPYRPPRIVTERTFEQNTLACGKSPFDTFVQACVDAKSS